MNTQICKICNQEKNIEAFDRIINKGFPNKKNTYRKQCRTCRNKPNSDKYYNNPENAEKIKEYYKKYQKEKRNPEIARIRVVANRVIKYGKKVYYMDREMLMTHLESLFTDDMSWDNYGIYWEIDHINGVTKMYNAGYTEEQINMISNLRPLKIKENLGRPRKYKE